MPEASEREGGLVLKARPEDGKNHEVGEREHKLPGSDACGFRCLRSAGEDAEMPCASQFTQFVEGHTEEAGHFHIGEEFLAGANPQHA